MAAPLFSQVKEFDGEREEWSYYVERLDHFFEANEVTNADKKRAILLTVIGPSAYKLLRSLLAPAKLKDKTYTELVGILKKHYSPKPSETAQRFRFNSQFRQPEESVSTFMLELRSLAEFCNVGTALEDMLRDRLVCDINDSAVQWKLLSEHNLTFNKALEMVQSHETAVRNTCTLQTGTSDVSESVHTLQKFQHSNNGPGSDSCYRSCCNKMPILVIQMSSVWSHRPYQSSLLVFKAVCR